MASLPPDGAGYRVRGSVSCYPRLRAPVDIASFCYKGGPSLLTSLMCFSYSFSRLSSLSLGDSAPERKSPSHHRQPSDASETTGNLLGINTSAQRCSPSQTDLHTLDTRRLSLYIELMICARHCVTVLPIVLFSPFFSGRK